MHALKITSSKFANMNIKKYTEFFIILTNFLVNEDLYIIL